MSTHTLDCPKELTEKIKTEMLAKADRENIDALVAKWAFWSGVVLLALIVGVWGGVGGPSSGSHTMFIIFVFPTILMGVGAYFCYQDKFHKDHKFHAVADQIREERSRQHSYCAQKIMENYSTSLIS